MTSALCLGVVVSCRVLVQFAEALEVIPRTLAENAGLKATDVVSQLYAAHAGGAGTAGVNVEVRVFCVRVAACRQVGVRTVVTIGVHRVRCCLFVCQDGGVVDASAKFILDSYATKVSAFNLACDAALTVLRVDQIIMSKQAGGPKPRDTQAPDMD